jgi:tape measure domain-containing protein
MGKLKQSIGSLGGVIAGAFSVGAVVQFGKAVIDSLKNYEYFHSSLKTMLSGNENATKALETQLMNLAKTTPFELTEVQNATKQLMAYGFQAGDVVKTMEMLGDVSSGVGAPLGDITYLYGTLRASGRVALMDIRQFAGRGIPIYEALAKRLKVTTGEINGLVSAGKVGFKDVEGAFKDMTKEGGQFFNLMADQSKTVGGQLSNLGDSWEQLKVNIGKSQRGIIASTTSMVSELVSSLNEFMIQANKIDEAFDKFGAKAFSFGENVRYALTGGGGAKGDIQMKMAVYQNEYQKMLQGGMAEKTLGEAKFRRQLANITKQYAAGEIDKTQYLRESAVLRNFIGEVQGSRQIQGMTASKSTLEGAKADATSSAKSTLETGAEVSGKRPQSLTINIDKLIEQFNLSTTNIQEGTTRVKEMVAKALLESVNDINLMATS